MKCEYLLSRLETGNPLQRAAARRHVAECPACAAALAALNTMKQQMAAHEPLSPRARQLWSAACEENAIAPSRRRFAFPVVAGMAGVACVVLIVVNLTMRSHPVKPVPMQVAHVDQQQPTVETIDPSAELAHLDADARNLDQKLADLRQRAQRLEARRQVAIAYQHYSHW